MNVANWIDYALETLLYHRRIEHKDLHALAEHSLVSLHRYLRLVLVFFTVIVILGTYSMYRVADYMEVTLWTIILCLTAVCGLFLQCMLGHSHSKYCQFIADLADQNRDHTILDERVLYDVDFLTSVGLAIYGTRIKH